MLTNELERAIERRSAAYAYRPSERQAAFISRLASEAGYPTLRDALRSAEDAAQQIFVACTAGWVIDFLKPLAADRNWR